MCPLNYRLYIRRYQFIFSDLANDTTRSLWNIRQLLRPREWNWPLSSSVSNLYRFELKKRVRYSRTPRTLYHHESKFKILHPFKFTNLSDHQVCLWEIDFPRNWYMNSYCDDHLTNLISISDCSVLAFHEYKDSHLIIYLVFSDDLITDDTLENHFIMIIKSKYPDDDCCLLQIYDRNIETQRDHER